MYRKICIILLGILFFAQSSASAQDARLTNIIVTNTRDDLLVYLNVEGAFREKMKTAILSSGENGEPIITQSLGEAKKLMAEIDSLKIIPLNMLEKGKNYQIRAKAELSKVTLPFYLHYVFIFVSLWDFETDLYTIDFIY
jgi:hypothetical protein